MWFLLACSPRLTPTEQRVETEHVALVEAFAARVDEVGFAVPAPRPEVKMKTTPRLVSYRGPLGSGGGTLFIPLWAEVDPDVQALMEELGVPCGHSGEAMFSELFHWFFGPHEMGHSLQAVLWSDTSRYQRELEANRFAVDWWATHEPERAEALVGCLAELDVGAPVPKGDDPEAWFSENYDTLVRSPRDYAGFQFDMVRKAWAERDEHDFVSLVAGVHDGRG